MRSALRRLKVGTRAGVVHTLSEPLQMAITGNVFLVRDGLLNVTDDREMHARGRRSASTTTPARC